VDISEQQFQAQVIERSHQVPVVVDFWAEWCAPCRQLGPLIEQAVAERPPIELRKLDVDHAQQLAREYRIQGIPAVKAFKDGRVAAEFVGAQPRPAVERFLDSLLPSPADELISAGDEQSLRQAHELEPTRADAAVPLARLLLARGESEQALEILRRVPGSFAADGLAARIELERTSDSTPPELDRAFSALDRGDLEEALEVLLQALPGSDGARDGIRRVVVGILDELGIEHPVAREARRKLAAALY
jgi:putative thioredoxin